MRRFATVGSLLVLTLAAAACQRTEDPPKLTKVAAGSATTATAPLIERPEPIKPPVDLNHPPLDATKTSSGLIYKKLETVKDGPAAQRNDTVALIYTGWRQSTGETFFSNRGKQAMALPLANTAPGFAEAILLMRRGERVVMWLPPEISQQGQAAAGAPKETLVYEVELVDIQPAPPVPADLSAPPPTAAKLPLGTSYVVIKTGTGKDKPRAFDTVTFNYTAWDHDGRMFDSTEMRNRPATVPPYRQSRAMEEMLTSMLPGSRVRFWVDAARMQMGNAASAGMPTGLLVYEIELVTISKGNPPPPVPADVKAAPANALRTEHGVAYRVLASGGGTQKPTIADTVKVHYTGWTTDGRMIDSTVVKGEPAELALGSAMSGWGEGIPVMAVGDRVRFWVPESMAWGGAPGKPQGVLVFDVELLEITTGRAKAAQVPAPADVAAPPADAKKSKLGVFYKVLVPGTEGEKPTPKDTIRVNYTGWTTDGKMFESTLASGQPVELPLYKMTKGWIDAVPTMNVGETTRFWIPAALAYKQPPAPAAGMLVFDIELVSIKPAPPQ